MKLLIFILSFSACTGFAKELKTEKSKFKLNQKQKIQLCLDFADERFCGSNIDEKNCLNDFEYSGQVKYVAGSPKAVIKNSFKLKSKDNSFEFTKYENYTVSIIGGELKSRYSHEVYLVEGIVSKDFVPSFIVDSSCRGDDDDE